MINDQLHPKLFTNQQMITLRKADYITTRPNQIKNFISTIFEYWLHGFVLWSQDYNSSIQHSY